MVRFWEEKGGHRQRTVYDPPTAANFQTEYFVALSSYQISNRIQLISAGPHVIYTTSDSSDAGKAVT
jgi:hypothetical protein